MKPDGYVLVANGWFYWDCVSLESEDGVFRKALGERLQTFESLHDYEAAVDDMRRQGFKAKAFRWVD